ncbi:hypothetical protein B0F90DRAFT_1802071, partial [Multifurca ochricompacta]
TAFFKLPIVLQRVSKKSKCPCVRTDRRRSRKFAEKMDRKRCENQGIKDEEKWKESRVCGSRY